MTVYCKKCKLVYADAIYLKWGNNCFRCDDGKLVTEIIDWLMVVKDAVRGKIEDN